MAGKEPTLSLSPEKLIQILAQERRALAQMWAIPHIRPVLDLDLTLQQIKILLLVASGSCVTSGDLARRMSVSPPTMSASIHKLIELGYLQRQESGPDRRIKTLHPTTAGISIYEFFTESKGQHPDSLLLALDPEDLQALVRGISAVRRKAEELNMRDWEN